MEQHFTKTQKYLLFVTVFLILALAAATFLTVYRLSSKQAYLTESRANEFTSNMQPQAPQTTLQPTPQLTIAAYPPRLKVQAPNSCVSNISLIPILIGEENDPKACVDSFSFKCSSPISIPNEWKYACSGSNGSVLCLHVNNTLDRNKCVKIEHLSEIISKMCSPLCPAPTGMVVEPPAQPQ